MRFKLRLENSFFISNFLYLCHNYPLISVIYVRKGEATLTVLNISSKKESNIDIESIVGQVKSGDIQAYTEIIRCFQKPIYIYCYYLLRSKEDAEDASQDIFIKGLEHIDKFSYHTSFSGWLYKIAHHHCIDLLKKRNKGFKFWTSFKKDHNNQTYIQESRHDNMIHELLEELNMDEKRILLLRSIEEYSFEEIASIMGIKATTVRKKYERLRKKIKKEKKLGGSNYGHSLKTEG